MSKILIAVLAIFIYLNISEPYVYSKITGPCVNCHTMHNSQNGSPVDSNGPQSYLVNKGGGTKSTCWGCHAQGLATHIDPVTGAPQVFHTGLTDLAAGNFAYITGGKGAGASNAKGHNVIDTGVTDSRFIPSDMPPGSFGGHGVGAVSNFSCTGNTGCHMRDNNIKGSHHQNVSGKCDVADTNYNSYRFLKGVRGFENDGQNDASSKWQNKNASNHNEYFGAAAPMTYTGCNTCHATLGPPNHTVSGFCGMCHGDFHLVNPPDGSGGIGSSTSSPWIRHPNDIVIPNSGEYSAYTAYSIEAPVARTTVPSSMSATVTPGADVVMCLSCHMAHASNYPSMLRWDYTTMVAGGGGSGGCFTCHSQKK